MQFLFLLGALLLTNGLLFSQLRQGDLILTPATGNPALLSAAPTSVSGSAGSVSLTNDDDGVVVAVLPAIGYAITNDLVAGIGVNVVVGRDAEEDSADGISPYLRYYIFNRELWHLYGGGRATIILTDSDVNRFGRTLLSPAVGVGVALGEGLFFSPEVSYAVNREGSPVQLELKFDVLFPTRRSSRFARSDRYEQGAWMLGTRMGELSAAVAGNGRNSLKLSPEVHFFVADQLALGFEFGTEISWAEDVRTSSNVHGGLSLRYVPVHDRVVDLFGQAGIHVASAGGYLPERLDPDGGALFHVGAGIGAMLFPRDYFALEAGLGIAHYPVSGFAEIALSGGVRIFPGR